MLFKSAYLGNNEIVKAYKGDTLFYEKSGSELPSGYTKVDNVYALDRFGAYAWINHSINQNTRIELDFIANFDSNNLFYAYNASNYEQFAILIYGRGTDVGVRINGTAYRSGHTITDGDLHKFVVDSKKLYLDGDLILDFSTAPDYAATKLSIFRYITSTEYSGTSKIVGVKLTNNGRVSLNLIPCLDADGVACLYDSVSGTTHYSADATPFSCTMDNDYTKLAYIAGTS